MVSAMRSLKCSAIFGSVGVMLAIIIPYFVFVAHHDRVFSMTDTVLLYVSMWPQMLLEHLGFSMRTPFASIGLNCAGWAMAGATVGALLRRRSAGSTSTI